MIDGSLGQSEGVFGSAVRWDSKQRGAVDLGKEGDFERDQPFSFSYWARLDGDRVHVPIARMDSTNDYRGWDVFVYQQRAYIHLIHRWPDNCITVETQGKLPIGEWHHFAVTYDGSSQGKGVTLYLDGKPLAVNITHDTLSETLRTERPLFLGRRYRERDYHGDLDDVRVYGRTLSEPEVAGLVAEGVSAALAENRAPAFLERYHRHAEPDEERSEVDRALAEAQKKRKALEADTPRLPIMAEVSEKDRRQSFVLAGGNFLSPNGSVSAAVPAAFHAWPTESASDPTELPRNRAGFARWLTHPDNPLTARVHANRIWGALFGIGLVETQEDFGTQGELPSHPELLDHLALYLVENGWSQKALIRHLVLSKTYRQSSHTSAHALTVDPRNRYHSRASRTRLGAEAVRDQALAVSGLLSSTQFGPPVFPPQPDGVWQVVYSADRWTTSQGDDRYRRGLYTFWRRTSPYPSFTIFDAPSREVCAPRRIRSANALQALVTLNDPVYHEVAQALAARVLSEHPDTESESVLIDDLFRRVLCRSPRPSERATIAKLLEGERHQFRADPKRLDALLTLRHEIMNQSGIDRVELGAWVIACGVLLNLDEFLTRG